MAAWRRERRGIFVAPMILARGWLIERARTKRLRAEVKEARACAQKMRVGAAVLISGGDIRLPTFPWEAGQGG